MARIDEKQEFSSWSLALQAGAEAHGVLPQDLPFGAVRKPCRPVCSLKCRSAHSSSWLMTARLALWKKRPAFSTGRTPSSIRRSTSTGIEAQFGFDLRGKGSEQ